MNHSDALSLNPPQVEFIYKDLNSSQSKKDIEDSLSLNKQSEICYGKLNQICCQERPKEESCTHIK